MSNDVQQQKHFEDEVRRLARELWPDAKYDGATKVSSLERDGVFFGEETINVVEATISRQKAKASKDGKKIEELIKLYQRKHPEKAVKGWFVTREEPTADQRDEIRKFGGGRSVVAISFGQFQNKLVDAAGYLELRGRYPFGSVRDPSTGKSDVVQRYIPIGMINVEDHSTWTVKDCCREVVKGQRFDILGDYGAGKSMTLREFFKQLAAMYRKKAVTAFPVYINLRDHLGQTHPAEVLERHARNIGFPRPDHLVRAWRAGYVILLLDGFDELTTLGIQGLWRKLYDIRFRSMEVLRRIVGESPTGCGIVLSGRAHFFDSASERERSLSVNHRTIQLSLSDFTDEQIRDYLSNSGFEDRIPTWLPARPLLLGYLSASNMIQEIVSIGSGESYLSLDPGVGWNLILDKVCGREAEIEAGIDGPTVRRILERLASVARRDDRGLGPLTPETLVSTFAAVCGYEPDEKGMVLIQRLPGLGIEREDEQSREFIDKDFADACRAGDILRVIEYPYGEDCDHLTDSECPLQDVGIGVLTAQSADWLSEGRLNAAIVRMSQDAALHGACVDLIQVALERGFNINEATSVRDIIVPTLDFDACKANLSKVVFQNCLFSEIRFPPEADVQKLPRFQSCLVLNVEGRGSEKDLPNHVFDEQCEFSAFSDETSTNQAISDMSLLAGAKVMLSVLRKIYFQGGSGRKENALYRGMDHHSRRLVSDILQILRAEGLVLPYKRGGTDMTIWMPNRKFQARAATLIESPHTTRDPVLEQANRLE